MLSLKSESELARRPTDDVRAFDLYLRSLSTLLGYRLWRPRHLALVLDELRGAARQPVREPRAHLAAALEWIERAQDVRDGCHDTGGVSAGWTFTDGWLPSYPETSGYIIETLLAAARRLERPPLARRAARILDWELTLQRPDGSFPGHFNEPGAQPVVFNTGQVMHGLVSGAGALGRADALGAAVRAGRWLATIQDQDGGWRRHTFNGIPHVYNTRTAWAVLRTAQAAGDRDLEAVGRLSLEWALLRQLPNGGFLENAFRTGALPFTHNIAYAIRGLLESGLLLGEERWVAAAERAAAAMLAAQRADGSLAGTYDEQWRPRAAYVCVTGVAQMSIIWSRLARSGRAGDWSDGAGRANRYLCGIQRITGRKDAIDGGIPGSAPLWGAYERFMYPNWAAKFFADALMLEMEPGAIPEDGGA